MKVWRVFAILAAFLLAALSGLSIFACPPLEKDSGNGITVVASIFPVYDFSRTIAGPNATVEMLLTPGTEPHSFEPTPRDIVKIKNASIFIYNGEDMEPWVEEVLAGISGGEDGGSPLVIDSSKGIFQLPVDQEKGKREGEKTRHGAYDPHIWLDFDNAKIQIDNILAGFMAKDPAHGELYAERAKKLKLEIDDLDARYRSGLSYCEKTVAISAGHAAFGYLAHRYGFEYRAVYGIAPNAEPSPSEVIAVIETIKRYGVRYVLAEALINPKMAQTIRGETGVEILYINPGGNVSREDYKAGITYTMLMKDNLEKIEKALECLK